MIEAIINYFEADPLRILYIIGGSGGMWYWIQEWRNRTRVKVRFIHEHYDPVESPLSKVDLKVEVTNIGDAPTSLEQTVIVVGYTSKHKKKKFALRLQEPDRSLPPHQPKQFNASEKLDADYAFMWFKKYTFKLTKGINSHMRTINASGRERNPLERFLGVIGFKLFNKDKVKA